MGADIGPEYEALRCLMMVDFMGDNRVVVLLVWITTSMRAMMISELDTI